MERVPQPFLPHADDAHPNITSSTTPQTSALEQVIVPRRFEIVGVRSIPFIRVSQIFESMAGKTLPVSAIVEGAKQVTQLYQDAGYALSFAFVPPQNFDNGLVRVVVVEGYLDSIQVTGDTGESEDLLKKMAEPLLTEHPLTDLTFDRQTF